MLTPQQLIEYKENGFFIIPNLLSNDEVQYILKENEEFSYLDKHTMESKDATGKKNRLSLWFNPPENIYGNISRSHKIVDRVEEMLDGEAYHWHSKMILKEARTGGAWEWHQDYGYWYNDNCLCPDLVSVMMAINQCTIENGCLEVLAGSHKLGRIDHGTIGKQTGADMQRVLEAEKIFKKVYVELNPGDALFFHCNLLHCSAPNQSDIPRVTYIACYNKKTNSPFGKKNDQGHPVYKPIIKVENDKVIPRALANTKEKITA